MELGQVEKKRYELLQLLLLLIMVFLGIITYTSVQQGGGYLIPSLTILSLLACLYVISKERSLKKLQAQLIQEIIQKDRQVKKLDQELKEEQAQLEDEKDRSDKLGLRLKELTALYRAINTVNSVREPQRSCDTVLRAALELVGSDAGSIMLMDESGARLSIACAQGLSDDTIRYTWQRIGEGIAGWVAHHRKPLPLTEELKQDERFRDLILRDEDIRSAMSVPLEVRDRVIGVINFNISRSGSKKQFMEYDLRMASIFAQHASVAIENTQLLITIQKMKTSLQPA